jgi:hypothetical protein
MELEKLGKVEFGDFEIEALRAVLISLTLHQNFPISKFQNFTLCLHHLI